MGVVSWHQMDTRLTRFVVVLDTRLVLETRLLFETRLLEVLRYARSSSSAVAGATW